jgi:Phospholipase_D-nuclease N-terminal
MVLAATDYPLLDVFWTTLLLFGWILWFWFLFRVYTDLFRRDDIGGWAKTGWVAFTLFLPFLGVLTYLVTQGRSMAERAQRDLRIQQAATDDYIRSVAADTDAAQMAKARSLRDSGALTQDEYDRITSDTRAVPTPR